jgi:hypothetical protein
MNGPDNVQMLIFAFFALVAVGIFAIYSFRHPTKGWNNPYYEVSADDPDVAADDNEVLILTPDQANLLILIIGAIFLTCLAVKAHMFIDASVPHPSQAQTGQLADMKYAVWGCWLAANIAACALFNRVCKSVRIDGRRLYVSHYWGKRYTSVDLSDIADIVRTYSFRAAYLTLYFKRPTALGMQFGFYPLAPSAVIIADLRKRAKLGKTDFHRPEINPAHHRLLTAVILTLFLLRSALQLSTLWRTH